jgi:hypothetical protein
MKKNTKRRLFKKSKKINLLKLSSLLPIKIIVAIANPNRIFEEKIVVK